MFVTKIRSGLVLILAASALLGGAPLAGAEDRSLSSEQVVAALEAAASRAGEPAQAVLSDRADAPITPGRGKVFDRTVSKVHVSIPDNPKEAITLSRAGQDPLSVSVTVAHPESQGSAEALANGAVGYSAGELGFDTAVVVKNEGSVQIATVIADNSAPTEFGYKLGLPDGTSLYQDPGGSVLATDADGKLVAAVAPAWAFDANGASVPTRYVIDGTTLTQVVDHRDSKFAYPIVADPWLWIDLFSNVYTTSYNGAPKVVITLSTWGNAVHTGVAQGGGVAGWTAGQGIFASAGWSELVNKASVVTTKDTYRQQYDCHVLGAYPPVSGGPTWDLEGFRPNNPTWMFDILANPCNW